MYTKLWISTLTVASLAGLALISPIAKGESRNMNKDGSNVQSTSGSVEQTNHSQTQRDVSDYWTPQRMRNAKPATPTVSDSPSSRDYWTPEQMQNAKPAMPTLPSSGNAQPPEQGQNVKPAIPPVSDSPQGDYWTPERMRNAKPAMPTISDTPSSRGSSNGSGAR